MLFVDLIIITLFLHSLLGYEGLEVINPEGGTDDVEEEAKRGRWKQEVPTHKHITTLNYSYLLAKLFYFFILFS